MEGAIHYNEGDKQINHLKPKREIPFPMKEVRQGNMAEKVFISYSHQDGSCARGIARYLERHGLKVWIDSKDLALGDRWANNIETALSEADVLIGILSSSSLRRKEVLKEINSSVSFILPGSRTTAAPMRSRSTCRNTSTSI